jgi:DNA-binding transcriptional MerR regulator
MSKSPDAFRTISEVSDELGVPKHVLRFWEQKFPQIKPMKRGGGRRYYRPQDLELLRAIQSLLHTAGYTIRGVQKLLRDRGADALKAQVTAGSGGPAPAAKKIPGKASAKSAEAKSSDGVQRTAMIKAVTRELEMCLALLRGEAKAALASAQKSPRRA